MKQVKLGYQPNYFNQVTNVEFNNSKIVIYPKHKIAIQGHLHEEAKHYGRPCVFTDKRFSPDSFWSNYISHEGKYFNKHKSIKATIRFIRQIRDIPVGTLVYFMYRDKAQYVYKVRSDNKSDFTFNIDSPHFVDNFKECDKSAAIVDTLRKDKFIVWIEEIYGTEIAFAYGYGLMIGFAEGNEPIMNYEHTEGLVVYDKIRDFNKWRDCSHSIDKSLPPEEIVNILKRPIPRKQPKEKTIDSSKHQSKPNKRTK